MRKILLIFILTVSSFFVFNINVKADTITHIVDEKDFLLLTDEFYLLRDKSIEYANTNNKYYIIYNTSNGLRVYFYDKVDTTWQTVAYSSINYPRIQVLSISAKIYKLDVDNLVRDGSASKIQSVLRDTSYENLFSYALYLDTNIENLKGIGGYNYMLNYNDFSYTVNEYDHFPSLYEFSLLANPPEEEPEELPRNESLDSFYNLVIEKIQLFANYFIINSALLFIIGIIILIFIAELIFRRLL